MQSKKTPAQNMALGGILAALAVVIMSLGTLIPVATYTAPVLCMILLKSVLKTCGGRVAWAWYGAVAILSALMAPDKEAAGVFAFLGYYPIVKPKFDRLKGKWLWKALYFNVAVCVLYWLLSHLLGLPLTDQETPAAAAVLLTLTLILGNVTFFLVDMLLGMRIKRRR